MNLKKLVADYAAKTSKGVEVNLEALSKDDKFRSEVLKAILAKVKEKPEACVYFPSYKISGPLGKLINEVALSLQVITLVTGSIDGVYRLHDSVKDIIVIKQSFRTGAKLKEQILELKAKGYNVSVICLIAHSKKKTEVFQGETGADVSALVYTEEI